MLWVVLAFVVGCVIGGLVGYFLGAVFYEPKDTDRVSKRTLRYKLTRKLLLAALLAGFISPASADTFDWTYNSDSSAGVFTQHGTGVLTTGDTVGNGGFVITSITGTWSKSFGPPVTDSIILRGGGVLYPTNPQLLDERENGGVSFLIGNPPDPQDNFTYRVSIYALATGGYGNFTCGVVLFCEFGVTTVGTFTISPVQAVPGPIAGAGIPGLVLAVLFGWWKRRQFTASAIATSSA